MGGGGRGRVGLLAPLVSCRIDADPTAVTDPELRAHGMAGLRVADASVKPSMVSAKSPPCWSSHNAPRGPPVAARALSGMFIDATLTSG
jgi:hypothetical protein